MNDTSSLLGLALVISLAACAASTNQQSATGGTGGSGGSTAAGGGGSTNTGGAAGGASTGGTAGSGGTGGAPVCGTALDQTGCPCTAGEAPRDCWVGAAGMAGVGVCSLGAQPCVEVQNGEQTITAWGACTGQGIPGVEACNGIDDNCDAVTDEGCQCAPGDTMFCATPCGTGVSSCTNGLWGDCVGPQPNPDGSCPESCNPAGAPPTPWEAFPFVSYAAATPCAGARHVRYVDEYGLWVGAVSCTPTRYKLFLGATKDGTFYQMGDYAGNGQDHCEMVNDAFTIPNEDDVQSGGCAACALGPLVFSDPGLGPVFSRATFGSCFDFEPAWPQFNLYSVEWYECGVAIP